MKKFTELQHKSRLQLLSRGFSQRLAPFSVLRDCPFYFPFTHLLNRMDFLIVCFAEQIYLCSFSSSFPKGSY